MADAEARSNPVDRPVLVGNGPVFDGNGPVLVGNGAVCLATAHRFDIQARFSFPAERGRPSDRYLC
jgi:hypothetical protein